MANAGSWRLGGFEVDGSARRVLRDGNPVAVGARAFDLLCALIESHGTVVDKRTLIARAWPGLVVEENNLSVQVAGLRKALGMDAIATVAGRGYQLAWKPQRMEPGASLPSLAVLAFDLPGDHDRIAQSLAEGLVDVLARFRSLRVSGLVGQLPFDRQQGAREVAAALRVRYLLDGSITHSAGRWRVLVRLLDGEQDRLVWSDSFFPAGADELAGPHGVAAQIASAVQPQLEFAERNAGLSRVTGLTPNELALRAWAILRRHDSEDGKARRDRARHLAEQALQADPLNPLAARTVAWARFSDLFLAETPQTVTDAQRAVGLLTHVIASDPLDHHSYHYRGVLQFMLRRHAPGIDDMRRAHELNPVDPITMAYLGSFEATCGRPHVGLPYARRALELSPRDPQAYLMHSQLAICHFASGQDEDALLQARQCATQAPWFPAAWFWVAVSAEALGRHAEAFDAVQTVRRLAPAYLEERLAGVWRYGGCPLFAERTSRLLRESATRGESPQRS